MCQNKLHSIVQLCSYRTFLCVVTSENAVKALHVDCVTFLVNVAYLPNWNLLIISRTKVVYDSANLIEYKDLLDLLEVYNSEFRVATEKATDGDREKEEAFLKQC